MSETKHVPPFYKEDIATVESISPFTTSFNLDEPKMIDLNMLEEQEKITLLRELEKRQNAGDIKISWTKDHASLLLKLRNQLEKNENSSSYVPLKDRRVR
jgi:hypothetical protein